MTISLLPLPSCVVLITRTAALQSSPSRRCFSPTATTIHRHFHRYCLAESKSSTPRAPTASSTIPHCPFSEIAAPITAMAQTQSADTGINANANANSNSNSNGKTHTTATTKPSVCIVGGGNAAHALAALLPSRGYTRTTLFCPFEDEAARIRAGMREQNGVLIADFANHNTPRGTVVGRPSRVSEDASVAVAGADVLLLPLPSFVYPSVLTDLKPHLREGQVVCVTPGQGGLDWFAREIWGEKLLSEMKITLVGLMPMPFNCRITEYGKKVHVQEFKTRYSIGVWPRTDFGRCKTLLEDLLAGGNEPHQVARVEPAGHGSFLECSLFPINAVIHPARLYTLLTDETDCNGGGDERDRGLPENPLFYEDATPSAARCMDAINRELMAIGDALTREEIPVSIPHCYDWLACYVYGEEPVVDDGEKIEGLLRFFRTNPAYKGFRCPLRRVPSRENGNDERWVPDFRNRYFTEDLPLGLCVARGLAEIAGVPTPTIDAILVYFQERMGKEYLVVANNNDNDNNNNTTTTSNENQIGATTSSTGNEPKKLAGADIGETSCPQRFGIHTLDDLRDLYK